MQAIREHFEKIQPLSEHDWKLFSSKLNYLELKKKQHLITAGQIENNLSFIEKGIVRAFIPGEENDLTFAFAFPESFVSAYDSFLSGNPSSYSIEALTDLSCWQISRSDLEFIYASTQIGNLIGRKAAEELYLKKSKREISLLHENATQRYERLFDENPELIKYIPLKYLASYIGITPQAISRIRKRIS